MSSYVMLEPFFMRQIDDSFVASAQCVVYALCQFARRTGHAGVYYLYLHVMPLSASFHPLYA